MSSTTMPRSALRHRPIGPDLDVPTWTIVAPTARPRRRQLSPASLPTPLLVGLSMLITLLLFYSWLGISSWGSEQLDTLRYGYPRVTQLDHNEGSTLTHFIATNDQGQVYVLVIPKSHPAASHLLVGPDLIGPGADLAPVELTFQGDPQHPDLLIKVAGAITRFHDTGASYQPVASQ